MLYKFYIEDCVPCKELTKTLQKMGLFEGSSYTAIDAENPSNKALVEKYEITCFPTLVLDKENSFIKLSGNASKKLIKNFLKNE